MIKDLKLYPATTCHAEDTIIEVAKKMRHGSTRHIYVTDSQHKAVGIISNTDFTNKVVAEGKSPQGLTAKEIMNSPVESVELSQEAEHAMAIMLRRKTYSCLVTEHSKVKGVVDYKAVMERIISKIKGA